MKQLLKNSIITFIVAVVCLSCCFLNAEQPTVDIGSISTNLLEIQSLSTNIQSYCEGRINSIDTKINESHENLTKAIKICDDILGHINNNDSISDSLDDFNDTINKINISVIEEEIAYSKKKINDDIECFNISTNSWEEQRIENLRSLKENVYLKIYSKVEGEGYNYLEHFNAYTNELAKSTEQFDKKTRSWNKEIFSLKQHLNAVDDLISKILTNVSKKIKNDEEELTKLNELRKYLCEHGKIKFDCDQSRKINIKIADKIIQINLPCGDEIQYEKFVSQSEYLKKEGVKVTDWTEKSDFSEANIEVKVSISGQEAIWYKYGTQVSDIIDENQNGRTFLYWSKEKSGEEFSGQITEPITLYPIYKKCITHSNIDIVNGKCPECNYCSIHKDTIITDGKCPECSYCPIHKDTIITDGKCPKCNYCPIHKDTIITDGKCPECNYCPIHKDTIITDGKCPECDKAPIKCNICGKELENGKCLSCDLEPEPRGWLYKVALFINKNISLNQVIVADVILFVIMILTISIAVARRR